MQLSLAIHGAAGRMGRRVVALASTDSRFRIAAAIDHPESPCQTQDAGTVAAINPIDVPIQAVWPIQADSPGQNAEVPGQIDVVIDFSLPAAVDQVVATCQARRWPLVIATTGLEPAQHQRIEQAAEQIPIVWAPSMSMAVNLAMQLSKQAGQALAAVPGGVDIEIIERHHRFKEDAPSGTALKFGELLAETVDGPVAHQHGRSGKTGARQRNEIGYHALRGGDNPGEHTIVFGMLGETLEIRVAASNRDCYAAGALSAAAWLASQPAGLYSMFDVLGLS
ncbi:4-hydroxy-tetrahydrodipicolinate reductase [Planctomycetaceae bacterium SH139]